MQQNECPVENTRIQNLNSKPNVEGEYILCWMQQSQRADFNPALEYAVWQANNKQLPLIVVFGLSESYPEANLRHYRFMLEGLQEVNTALNKRGIAFIARIGHPPEVALEAASSAAMIICDRGYLRHQRQWRRRLALETDCRVTQVESDVIVPVETASSKQEYAARTIRKKLNNSVNAYLNHLPQTEIVSKKSDLDWPKLDLTDLESLERKLNISSEVVPVSRYCRGGTEKAKQQFQYFLKELLPYYQAYRNKPEADTVSRMSRYLHFGQISPVWLALQIEESNISKDIRNAYIEQLLVRRELAINFVQYNDHYDSFEALPNWARRTLIEHSGDQRPYNYSREALETGETHDEYWNAAMKEMKITGYMHNYMRMYWGKKILEWSDSPEEAYSNALYLNNKYFLDGRDPVSYASVGWIFGLHDRPWQERPIFGKTRYMNARGLERKSDIKTYVQQINNLTKDPQ